MTTEDLAKLTPEEKRIRIAELCEWTLKPEKCATDRTPVWHDPNGWAHTPEWRDFLTRDKLPAESKLPDYLNDLNAMYEAEGVLTVAQCYTYEGWIGKILGDWKPEDSARTWSFHADAAQRADAFLLTVG